MNGSTPANEDDSIAQDIQDIEGLDIVSELLTLVCQTTGMGFAAIARVTDSHWTALAVHDDIAFGLKPGGQLDLHTTLCTEVRQSRTAIVIDQASTDPVYANHHTPRIYGIESYISVPIVLGDGSYYGNLCAIDPRPARLSAPPVLSMFTLLARLISLQLENNRRRSVAEAAMLDERAARELREQFIAVLGHDLRNPLQGVGAAGQLIARKSTQPEVVSMAQRIQSSVRRMAALIDDVVDFARGRLGGVLDAQLRPVDDLDAALSSVVTELGDANPDRTLIVSITIGRPVHCDRGRLQQLASNLLANALTHGAPEGAITFDARTERGADGGWFVLSVGNRGIPIAPQHLSRVFEPFWRSTTSSARNGLGLGLFICSQIVKAHHGTLDVRSTPEEGTLFTARIPLGTTT